MMALLATAACEHKTTPPLPPTPVNLQTVARQEVLYYDRYAANTQALSQVNLYPEVQGYITGIYFTEGSRVKKGQKLYEIDKRLFQASYDQAMANLQVAHGNTVQAKQDADRYEYLNKYKAVAKQLYDHAVIALQNAENAEKAAEQAVKTAKTNFTYSVITAPFDGTIGFSMVKLGNMVSVGQTVLNTISTDDPMAVDFLINEKQLPFFEHLQGAGQNATDSLFTILMPDNSKYPYPGKLSVIDRAVNAQTGAIRVRLVFPNPEDRLKVGMSCTVRVHNMEQEPQMLIPNRAVVEQMGEYFVFVAKDTVIIDSTKKDHAQEKAPAGPEVHAFQHKITPGQIIGPNIIVKDGISEGDRIVVDGVQLLHDGSRITTASRKPSAEGSKAQ